MGALSCSGVMASNDARYERAQSRRVFEEEKAQLERAFEEYAEIHRAFEQEKKHLDLEYEDAKSKGWYRKMRNVAKASAELNQKMEMIEEEAKRRQSRFMRKMNQEGEEMLEEDEEANLDEDYEDEEEDEDAMYEEDEEEAERVMGEEDEEAYEDEDYDEIEDNEKEPEPEIA